MTPEERQLLTTLADRIKNTPPQQQDAEAAQLLQQLTRERPDTVYVLAQTVLIQDFALRSAQAQIEDLQRQLSQQQPPSPERGSGSFLGSVPRVNPWGSRPAGDYPPPPEPIWRARHAAVADLRILAQRGQHRRRRRGRRAPVPGHKLTLLGPSRRASWRRPVQSKAVGEPERGDGFRRSSRRCAFSWLGSGRRLRYGLR